MRVGIDIRDLANPVVGTGKVALDLLRAVEEAKDKNFFLYKYDGRKYTRDGLEHITDISMRIRPYQFFKEQVFFGAVTELHKLDIIHFPLHMPPFYKRKRTKVVLHIHDIHSETAPDLFPPDMNDYFVRYRKKAARTADKIIVITDYVKNELVEKFGIDESKIAVIPFGVSRDFIDIDTGRSVYVREKYNLPERYILYVGSMEPWKNILYLIKEYRYYRDIYDKGISLVLVGRLGWDDTVNKSIIKAVSEDENILWLNYLPQEDLPYVYKNAALFVTASLYEGFGTILIEAMNSGLPVVASDRAGIPYVLGEGGILFDPSKKGALVDVLDMLFRDDVLRKSIAEKSISRGKYYRNVNYGKAVINLYEELCS